MLKQKFIHTNHEGLTEVEYDVQVQEVESVKGSKNTIGGMYLAEVKKIRGRSTKSNTLKSVRILKSVEAKKMTDKEFLELACSVDEARPVLQVSHKKYAADGFRMHILENVEYNCTCNFCKNKEKGNSPMTPDFIQIIPRSFKGEFTLDRQAILDACNQAKVFAREGSNTLRISITHEFVEFSAISEEFGKNSTQYDSVTGGFTKNYKDVEYHYTHSGQDLTIAFNCDFVLDAVKGLDNTVTVKFNGGTQPAIFTDGKRTALLMPIHLG